MDGNNTRYRAINIAIAVLGVLVCIGACFIPAPAGVLGDGSTDLIHMLMKDDILTKFAMPVLLMVLASVIVMIGRLGVLAVMAALAGGALFIWMDYGFAVANQACYGTLANGIGVVLVITAALLQAFGTPRARMLSKVKTGEAAEEREERSREYTMFFEGSPGTSAGGGVDDATGGIDLNELRYEALRIEGKDRAVADRYIDTDSSDDRSSDKALEDLLRSEISEVEEEEAPAPTIEEKIEANALAIAEPDDAAGISASVPENTTDFFGGLEDLFLDE